MNLIIDAGNSRIKVGLFQNGELKQKEVFYQVHDLKLFLDKVQIENSIISSVRDDVSLIESWITTSGLTMVLNSTLELPIKIEYKTPHTLGVDRIAAACGAHTLFPMNPCLVIDAGTCINYEFIDKDGVYYGGAISPGIAMRFKAMHTFTAKLPLVDIINDIPLTGNSTESCMQSGVLNGAIEELNGIISRYQDLYPRLKVILGGGDYPLFEKKLKHAIFVAPEIVLIGLNSILQYHVKH